MANPNPTGRGKPGSGRPKGSVNIYSREAVKKLEELGFDPIEEMIRQLNDINKYIDELRAKSNPSHIAITNLTNIRQRCVEALLRYGYSRTTESTEVISPDIKPFNIILTNDAANTAIPLEDNIAKAA